MSDFTLYGSTSHDGKNTAGPFWPTIVFGRTCLRGNKSFVSEADALAEAQKQVEWIKINGLTFLVEQGYTRI